MTSSPPGPDFARALAGHSVQTGPVSGIWSCIGPCGASSIDNVDGVPTTKAERQEQHRAHLAEVVAAELRDFGPQVPPGPCEAQVPSQAMPPELDGFAAYCDLRSGHAGRHEADLRGCQAGVVTWPDHADAGATP